MPTPTAIAPLLLTIAVLSSCITYDPIPTDEIEARIGRGDYVRLTTLAGEDLRLKVVEVDSGDASLVGKDGRVAFAEIARIERRRVEWGRTAAEVGGFTLFALLAIAAGFVSFLAAW